MSLVNHNFVSNKISQAANVTGNKASQGIYEESSTAKHRIGEKIELADGRCFRYGQTGAAIGAGLLVSQDVSATCLAETDDVIIAAAGDFSISAGSKAFQATLSGVSKNQYAGGLIALTDDAGEGHQYRIESNSATDYTTSGKVDFHLYDGLVVAVTTSSDIAITGNLWTELVGATAATDYMVSGVTPIAFTDAYYGWFQTAGIATSIADGTIAIGDQLTLSDGVAGAVQLQDAYTEPAVGYAVFAPDNTGHVQWMIQGLVA
jgi:hypothetical protein